ncbi:MAG: GDP-mannose 4,6-dehydratase [Acidobacteriota bacterium]|nr:GDP-mannose 4,6-dehydratase [Acidobacteriota bacterium]
MTASTLVTGASGFAGGHLLERLPRDQPIAAWSRAGHASGSAPHIAWRGVDLLDRRAVERALDATRPSVIFHAAGAPHVGASFDNPTEPLAINAVGTHHLLSAAARVTPDARVVVVTSAMIYRASDAVLDEEAPAVPSSPYGLSKLAQDRLAALAAGDGMDTVIARPFNHTGPRQQPSFAIPGFAQQIALIEAGRAEPLLRTGNLDAERDITDVRDVVDAYALLGRAGVRGTAYNVCTGHAWRIGDLLERLLSRSRVRVRVERDEARMRPVEPSRLIGDNTRLRALGWEPRVPIDIMLDDVLEYWRTQVAS